MDGITASEVAGLGVGALLFAVTVAAPKVDAFIASSQRSSLGMCKKCGNLGAIACGDCKGNGFLKDGGPFGLGFVDDLHLSFGDEIEPTKSKPCAKCRSKGRIRCPLCSEHAHT